MSSMPRIFTVLELSVPKGEAGPKVRKAILDAKLKLSEFSTKKDIGGVALESIPNNCAGSDWAFQDADLIDNNEYAWISMGDKSVALVHDLGQCVEPADLVASLSALLEVFLHLKQVSPDLMSKFSFQAEDL